jgi:hypothetical protein
MFSEEDFGSVPVASAAAMDSIRVDMAFVVVSSPDENELKIAKR